VAHLRNALEYDPFPYAPRLEPLKAILAKLDPPVPRPEPLPRLKILRCAESQAVATLIDCAWVLHFGGDHGPF